MKVTNRKLISFLDEVACNVQTSACFSEPVFVGKADMYLGDGETHSCFDDVDTSSIGIKELSDDLDGEVDDYAFMKGFIALLHESTHVYQREKLLRVDNKSSKYLAVNYMAISASYKYYRTNYNIMPCEIAAQYSAIKNGYDILTDMIGEDDANLVICNYVNKHIKYDFIDKPKIAYTNVSDILDDYDKAFNKSRETKRKFNTMTYKFNKDKDDVVTRNIKNNIDKDLIEEVRDSESGAYQDLLMAYLYIHSKYNHIHTYRLFDALSGIDMMEKSSLSRDVSDNIQPVKLDEVTPKFSIPVDDLSETIDSDDFDMDF